MIKLFRFAGFIAWKIPAPLLDRIGVFLGLLLFYLIPIRKKLVLFQLGMVFPEKSASEIRKLARQNYIHYGKLLVEFLLLIDLKPGDSSKIDKTIRCENLPALKDALKSGGKGAIITGGHVGLWEAIGPYLSRHGLHVTVAVKRVTSPLFQSLREIFQAHPGVSILDPSLGNRRAAYLLKALRDNRITGIFLDQYRHGEPFVPFLGHDARTNSTAAILYRKTRVPLFLIHVIRKRVGDYSIELHEMKIEIPEGVSDEDEIKAISGTINNGISEVIRRNPDQWLWAHRRFKENPLFRSVN
ncbi:MAG: hypothetical protein JNL74_05985 [Fibrobacteres bacterium]|nr:hypothetical protein [Fibrobacterota bacterium]